MYISNSHQSYETFVPFSPEMNVVMRKEFIHEDPYAERDIIIRQKIEKIE